MLVVRAFSTAARTVESARDGSATIRAASSCAAADAGPVIETAIFCAAVRAAPAYGAEASAAASATARAEASSAVKRIGGRVISGSIDQPPPRPGVVRTGTPASISAWRSRCAVRVLTSNRAASAATVSGRGAAARNSSTSA
ncbi:hypothetical protein GCM10009837_73130 [Streptomyces durmitorensis]